MTTLTRLLKHSPLFTTDSILFSLEAQCEAREEVVLDELLNLLSYSRNNQVCQPGVTKDAFLLQLVQAGAINALLLFCSNQTNENLLLTGINLLDECVLEPSELDQLQVSHLAHVLTVSLQCSERDLVIKSLALAKRCCLVDQFSDHFIKYLEQKKAASLLNSADPVARNEFIVLLTMVMGA
ncbi:hypothetical protein HDU91_007476, partial [Kappamyces sp. JEL0680]